MQRLMPNNFDFFYLAQGKIDMADWQTVTKEETLIMSWNLGAQAGHISQVAKLKSEYKRRCEFVRSALTPPSQLLLLYPLYRRIPVVARTKIHLFITHADLTNAQTRFFLDRETMWDGIWRKRCLVIASTMDRLSSWSGQLDARLELQSKGGATVGLRRSSMCV